MRSVKRTELDRRMDAWVEQLSGPRPIRSFQTQYMYTASVHITRKGNDVRARPPLPDYVAALARARAATLPGIKKK